MYIINQVKYCLPRAWYAKTRVNMLQKKKHVEACFLYPSTECRDGQNRGNPNNLHINTLQLVDLCGAGLRETHIYFIGMLITKI